MGLRYKAGQIIDTRTICMNLLITVWGTRLCKHIAARHKGEDYRYIDMRNRWKDYSTPGFYLQVFMYIFMM